MALKRAKAKTNAPRRAAVRRPQKTKTQRTPPKPKTRRKARPLPPPRSGIMPVSLDGADPRPVATLFPNGKSFQIPGISRLSFEVTSVNKTLTFATNHGRSGTVGIFVNLTSPSSVNYTIQTLPLLALSDTDGGPTAGRALKLSLSCTNYTPALHAGGRVYGANFHSRLSLPTAPSLMTYAQWQTVFTTISNFPETQVMSGNTLMTTKRVSCDVVDTRDYEDFDEWRGTDTADEWFRHIAIWPTTSPLVRPMSTLVLLNESVASNFPNQYSVAFESQHLTRWPISTVPGQCMKHQPCLMNNTTKTTTKPPPTEGGIG